METKFSRLFTSTLIIIILFEYTNAAQCPNNPEVLEPCMCSDSTIACGRQETIYLKNIFRSLSNSIPDSRKDFLTFELINEHISELEEITFNDITFKNIVINAKNLTRIHSQAFAGTNIHIKYIAIRSDKLSIESPHYNIFEAISAMNNLEELIISNTSISDIPKNAFKPINGKQDKLTKVDLSHNKIDIIGEMAFYTLDNLKQLDLSFNSIDALQEHTLKFERKSTNELNIDLSNNDFDSASFEVGSFNHFNRPTTVNIQHNIQLKHLDRNVFKPFFDIDRNNKIKWDGIDCNNSWTQQNISEICESMWLTQNYTIYETQINNITCDEFIIYVCETAPKIDY